MTSSSEARCQLPAWTVAALLLAALPQAALAAPPIDASVAPLYVGREMLVEGVVTAVERDGYIVRLRLGDPPQALRVQLVLGMLSRFPEDPQAHYLGNRVHVFGKITEFRGVAEIIVRDPERIALAEGASRIGSDEKAALLERLERLEERLRTLEAGSPPGHEDDAPSHPE